MTHLKHLIAAATGIALLATAGTASAAPTPFTFNPSLSSPALSNAGAFTADTLIFSQYTNIDITSSGGPGTFAERGILRVANFQNNGAVVLPPGFAGTTGANPYGLYLSFTGTGNINGVGPGAQGSFTNLSVSLIGDVGNDNGSLTVSSAGATFSGNTANDVVLATGKLVTGTVGLTSNSQAGGSPVLPSAFALVQFTDAPGAGGFFVVPTTMQFNLDTAFTNDSSVTTFAQTGTGVNLQIRAGAGNGNITAVPAAVPEPASLALIGAGLAAVSVIRRRRA